MAQVFEEMWRDTDGVWNRVRLGVRSYGRLPVVAVLEWMDVMGMNGTTTGGWDMAGWGSHLRFALRTLRKAPSFAITSVVLIGLGVGAVTAIFTVFDHVLLRPLPYPAADRLVTIEMGSHSAISYNEFIQEDGFEVWATGYEESANLTGEGDPVRIELATVSEEFFSVFGARPRLGRLFVAEDFESPESVVITSSTWRQILGADPDVVGRTLRIDDTPYTVVGVLSDDFVPPENIVSASAAAYRPIDWSREEMQSAGYRMLEVAGRMLPGLTIEQLQPRFDALAERVARAHPDQMMNRAGEWMPNPLAGLQDSTVERVRTGLNLLLAAVALLLVVACLNVAHLFLARSLGRVREMAVRRALGAGAGGLVQQLLTESLVIGALGGLFGLGLAWFGLEALLTLNPTALPRAEAVTLDLRVALFAIALSGTTAVVFGLLPALRAVRGDLTTELKGSSRSSTSGRGTRRVRSGLVVAEVALSLVLVAQAGLLLKSFMQVQANETGVRAAGVWTVPLTLTGPETPEEYRQEMDAIAASLASVPGVSVAGYGMTLPLEFTGGSRCCWSWGNIEVDGVLDESSRLMLHPISETYFDLLGIDLVVGSMWSAASEEEDPVPVVVSERLAIDAFGAAEEALGHLIGRNGQTLRIIGVAPDVKHYGLDQPDAWAAYVPIAMLTFTAPFAHAAVRIDGEAPAGLARSIREAIWREAPDMPVPTVQPLATWIDDSMAGRRFDSAIFGLFGMVALLLAAAGLYGTLLYTVRERTRELGIRLALGAARARVEGEVVRQGLTLAVLGGAIGVVASLQVGRLLESRLFEVDATDPMAVGGAALLLVVVAGFASWLPARRAGRTDPLHTLRVE